MTILEDDSVLGIYLYRDPRDVAVSAALYIKYALVHHPLRNFLSELSDADAIAAILAGVMVPVSNGSTDGTARPSFIVHEGIRYFCDWGRIWLKHSRVAALRYEDLIADPVTTLTMSLARAGVSLDRVTVESVVAKLSFDVLSGGRARGKEDKSSHYRKGVAGDYIKYFTPLMTAICKQRIGAELVSLGYERDLHW